jgi:hypothetical protein
MPKVYFLKIRILSGRTKWKLDNQRMLTIPGNGTRQMVLNYKSGMECLNGLAYKFLSFWGGGA